jgi:hypothetical protein
VLSTPRRGGIGAQVTREIIAAGCGRFDVLRLRASNRDTARLDGRLGFRRSDESDCSHVLRVGASAIDTPHI